MRRVRQAKDSLHYWIAVHNGQNPPVGLILCASNARNGAIGLVPPELDGAIVSNDFPSFEFRDPSLCDAAFMGWLVRSAPFVDLCKAASEGTTNRVRIKEERFLA